MVFPDLNVLELVHNITMAVALALVAVILFHHSKLSPKTKNTLLGIYYGLSAILLIEYTKEVYPGIRYDPRTVLVFLSGYQGGPISALLTAVLAGIYRVYKGGTGVQLALLGILWISSAGVFYGYLSNKDNRWLRPINLLLIVWAVYVILTALHASFFWVKGLPIFSKVFWLTLFFYPLALYLILLTELRLKNELKQHKLLEAQEGFQRLVLGNIFEGIISVDLQSRITYMNPSAEALTGWTFDEAKGRPLNEVLHLLHDETGETLQNPVERVLREGIVVGLGNHTLLRSKNGNIFPIADSAAPILGPQKEILGVVLVFKDQTQERNYTRQIEATRRMLTAVFDSVQLAIFICTPEGDLVECNQNALRMFGVYQKDAFRRKGMVHFSPPVQPDGRLSEEKAKEIIREATLTKKPILFEWLYQRVDGSTFPAEVTISTFQADEKPLILTTVRDITEKKQTFAQLDRERRQLLSIFNAIVECIYVADMESYEILFVNEKMKEVLKRDLTGEICYEVLQGRNSPCPFCTNQIIKKIKPNPFVWEHYNPVAKRWFYITDKVITWPDGRDVRFELAIDITEKKQAEEEKARLEAQLSQAQRLESIGRLAGGIAHDFNNILNIILGRAQLAKQKTKDQRIERDLNQIIEASNRATGIISQILSFARKQITNPIPVNLNNLIYQSLKVLGSIVGDNIHIQFKQEKDLWKVLIDPVQLDQILSNLIVNAKDAIQGHGEIVIKTENVQLDENHPEFRKEMLKGEYVMLSVSDTGHGIPEEIQSKIFEPFFTTKEPGKGTGLGLATVYGIVKQNNGYIYVDSRPKEGATFKIFLPKADSDAQSPGQITKPVTDVSFKGKKVVLVEDDKDLLDSVSEMLTLLGFEVEPHISPREALKELSHLEKRVDLLLTDVIMPELNGPELYNLVKDFRPDLKVLFTSGYADMAKEEVSRYKELLLDSPSEGRGFIPKPFTLEDLAQKLKTLLA